MKSKAVNSDPVTAGVMEVKDDLTAEIAEYLGVGSSIVNRREYLFFLAASFLVSLGILSLVGYIYLWPLLKPYYAIISDPKKISGLFRAAGDWAPIVCILLSVGQSLASGGILERVLPSGCDMLMPAGTLWTCLFNAE